MIIMSFNTQHCCDYVKGKIDYNTMADAIKACGAEIVGLNEMRGEGTGSGFEKQTEQLSALTGIGHYFFAKAIDVPDGGPYGNALLSKYPVLRAEVIPVPDPENKKESVKYESRCLLKAVLENGLTVMVIHFGLNPDEQVNAVKTVVDNLEKEKCILMGDFNVTPDDAVLKPIRERMKDTADLFCKPLLSYPSDKPKVKIDYIFVSEDLEVVSADIPGIIASDHRPHIAELITHKNI